MSTTYQSTVTVNAGVEDIEAYARYADSWPDWFPGITQVEVDETYPEVGSNAHVTFSAAGVNIELTLTVAEYVFGEIVTFNFDGMAQGTTSFYLEENGGAYDVTAYLEYALAGGVLGQVADKLVIERKVSENIDQALANMQAGLS